MTIKNTGKYLILRGCLLRYELALKAAFNISKTDKPILYKDLHRRN